MNTDMQARIVVAGCIAPTGSTLNVAPDFGTDGEWKEFMAAAIDDVPDEQDVVTFDELGRMDYEDGIYSPPRRDMDKYRAYLAGWNNAWAAANGRTLLR